MCGIAGILRSDGRPVDETVLVAMTRTLAHRGPDGEGFHVENGIGLGHRRLAILDTGTGGAQPMASGDGRRWVTYNGEVFNFLELRRELEALGYRFRTRSDTEVVLAAYERWGTDCLTRFNGMWAFALWDADRRTLFLARDRFGVKPLFYFWHRGTLAFASEMKAFLALPWFSGTFNDQAMARALEDPYALEPTDRCILRGVRRLRAGHMLVTDGLDEPRQHRWWCTLDGVTPNGDPFDRQVKRFKELLTDAVKIRMRSDVPLACALSGGLDSSSVLESMVAAGSHPSGAERLPAAWRRAFVATYPGTTADERAFAELVVSHAGVASSFLSMGPESVANSFDELVFQCEEVQSPHVGPWFLYEAMRSEGIRVSLDGHGGDELLAGYIHHVRFALDRALERWSRLGRAVELLAILEGMGTSERRWFSPLARWPRVLARYVRRKGMGRFDANQGFPADSSPGRYPAQRFLRIEGFHEPSGCDLFPESGRLSPFGACLYLDFHARALPTILRDFDRFSMAHGVEVRCPFVDWRLVRFCFSLPETAVLGGGYTKRILREAMRGILPEPVRVRTRKTGYKSPLDQWWRGELKELVLDTVGSGAFLQSPIWDGPRLRATVEDRAGDATRPDALLVLRFVVAHRLVELFKEARAQRVALGRMNTGLGMHGGAGG